MNMFASNLEAALARFRGAGYLMCHKKVKPDAMGIPMSRARYHFQGIRAGLCENEAAQMQELDEIWTQILVGRYPDLPIDSFLYAEDSPEFAEYLATLQSTHEFPKRLRKNDCKDKGNAWKILHEKFCIDHRVSRHCSKWFGVCLRFRVP